MSLRTSTLYFGGFMALTSCLLVVIGLVLGQVRVEDRVEYNAILSDASGMKSGIPVRAAGVAVGTVESVRLAGDHTVAVRFSIPSGLELSSRAEARVRWANLTGDRYFEITDSDQNLARGRLQPGGTIPLTRTRPALDLDTLFNGFKPLTQALDPGELNQFTSNLIAVAQGQSGAIESLLQHVGSMTTSLASRSELIGAVIVNFDRAVGTVADRDEQFDRLLVELRRVLDGLADDRKVIGASIAELDGYTSESARLVADIRPDVKDLVIQSDRLATNVNRNADVVHKNLRGAPTLLRRLSRVGAYGSFTNFYLCGVRTVFTAPVGGDVYTPWIYSRTPRCLR